MEKNIKKGLIALIVVAIVGVGFFLAPTKKACAVVPGPDDCKSFRDQVVHPGLMALKKAKTAEFKTMKGNGALLGRTIKALEKQGINVSTLKHDAKVLGQKQKNVKAKYNSFLKMYSYIDKKFCKLFKFEDIYIARMEEFVAKGNAWSDAADDYDDYYNNTVLVDIAALMPPA